MKKEVSEQENFRQLEEKADLSPMFNKQQFFNPYIYFYKLYNKFPHRHWHKDINKPKLLNLLSEKYNLHETAVFETHIHSTAEIKPLPGVSAYILSKELMLCFPPWEFGNANDAQLYYSDAVPKDELQQVLDIIKQCYRKSNIEKREAFLLMTDEDNHLYFRQITINTPVYDLQLHFNDDLTPVNDLLLNRLNKPDDNGLVIFYGKTGTGKTSYIRYLTSHVSKQKLFIPSSLTKKTGTSEFLDLLDGYHNSILIIEDADSILKKRLQDEDHIIANLLNLTDGILADVYHIQVICSFNNDISTLDPALIRKGRLIAKYYFKELSVGKTSKLCKSLGYKKMPLQEMSLADIYHWEEQEFQVPYIKGNIGFK